jgi:hypothetical protein
MVIRTIRKLKNNFFSSLRCIMAVKIEKCLFRYKFRKNSIRLKRQIDRRSWKYEVCPDDFRKGSVSGAAIGWEVA